ncbi:MAG TPA: PKD-like domain-containing protein, partial [Mucilaginibacter sp.]|nr:PKD-like domain-containing protein [Mucilaginibacter sp.]
VTTGTASGVTASGSGNNIADLLINTGVIDAIVTYTISPTYNSCPGVPFTLQVTVHPLPSATANAPSPVCNNVLGNANITLSSNVSNTSYTWTSSAPSSITGNSNQSSAILANSIVDNLVNSDTVPATVTYTITPYNGSCPGTPITVSVTVEPSPITANAGPAQHLCNTTSVTLHANDPAPQTGTWAQLGPPTPGIIFSPNNTDPNATVSGLTPGNTYQFQWTITASASCPTSSSSVSVIIDSAPLGGIATANPSEVCQGGTSSITLAGKSGTLVEWQSSIDTTVATNWISTTVTADTLVVTNLAQTTYYRALIHNGSSCPDVYSTIATVIVDPPPTTANAGPNVTTCYSSGAYHLSATTPTVGTGVWSQVSSGPTVSFSSVTDPHATVTPPSPGTYTFKWTITASASCPPSSSTVTITFDPPALGGTATANPAEVCLGGNSSIALAGKSGTLVEWQSSIDTTNASGWTSITVTADTLNVTNLLQTTYYRALIHNGASCPDAYSSTATVIVDPPPTTANAGSPATICYSSGSYQLSGNPPAVGTGVWSQVSSGPTASFSSATDPQATVTPSAPGVYTFKWTITASSSCPPSSSTVTITFDAPPIGGMTSSDAHVCLGTNAGTITLSSQSGKILRWESSTGGNIWLPIADTTNVYSYSGLIQTTQYRAVITNGVCPVAYSTPTTITVDQPPIAANAGPDNALCNQSNYALQGNNPLPGKGKWTVVGSPASIVFANDTLYNSGVSGLLPGTTYKFVWTISNRTGSCPPTTDTVTIKNDPPAVGGTTQSDTHVCLGANQGTIQLAGYVGSVLRWEYNDSGTWQTIFNTTDKQNYLDLVKTTQYRAWVQIAGSTCPPEVSTITTITVDQPPVQAYAGADDEVCSQTSYTLNANPVALPNIGQWTMVIGPSSPTFVDATNPKTRVDNLIPGKYTFRWTASNAAACPPTHDDVDITIDQAPVGGVTSADATVCSGGNQGQIYLSQQNGSVVRWEFSVDGTNWQPIANTTSVQSYLNLTQTTQYRTWVHNGITCPDVPSTITTITVNPPTLIADAGPNQNLCNQTSTTLKANNPGTFVGTWTQTGGPQVSITDQNNYITTVTGMSGGNVYKFTWTIKGLPPCGDMSADVKISVSSDITPSFAMNQDHGCGPVTVDFTNTSTPALTGGIFVWDFGDGSPEVIAKNPPSHTFQPSNDGTEVTYKVTLTPTSNCGSQAPFVAYVSVSSAKPIAVFQPSQASACGTFTLSAQNLSPGNNAQYDFYLKDVNGNIVQHLTYRDKRDAVFAPMTVTQQTIYTMYMTVTDNCGNLATAPSFDIPVSPSSLVSQIQIKGDVNSVCIGSPVTFQNLSSGGDTFTITVYDSNKKPIFTSSAGTGDFNYTPLATGVYYVSIIAGNSGCGNAPESALKQFTVYPIPSPSFTWSADQNFNVTFNNTTPGVDNIPASSLTYKWDFGDGSTLDPSYIPATHHFDFSKAPFTVTLTATTPGTDCSGVTSQSINITFKGNLFLPNAFIPASSDKSLNTFIAKGFGMKTWRMQIFNNFGQLVWQTTKLDSNGAPVEGWDGTYKGKIVEQGVYIWQISATLLNGEEWKGMSYHNSSPSKTGAIHLIR